MSNPDVDEMIIDYFKTDILNQKPAVSPETRKLIVDTFTYAHRKKQSTLMIIKELKGSELEQIRNRIIKRIESDNNPFPVRFGELKPKLHREASDTGRSITGQILKIVRDHYKMKEMGLNLSGYRKRKRVVLYHNQLSIFSNGFK